ncbi:hypothetical protein FQA39_LY08012 [Lamprigera yunnana]|nr:hypothetical protein FQA39_LY08012 [Lamprigera yunnana]
MKAIAFCTLWMFSVVFAGVIEDKQAQWENMVAPHRTKCIAESGVNDDEATTCFKNNTFPDNHEFKCYLKCIQVQLGFMDVDGNFNVDTAASVALDGDKKIAEECISEEADSCTKAYNYALCCMRRFMETLKKE